MPGLEQAPGPPALGLPVTLILLSLGWFVGSFPSAVVVGWSAGVDVLQAGDRNPGSANVWALAGPRAGLVAFGLDLLKVALPGLVGWAAVGWWAAWVAALGAVLGAMRPLTPRIGGGRGVAAGAGACLVLQPIAGALAIGAFALAYGLARRRVVAIAVGFGSYPLAFALLWVRSTETAWPLAGIGVLYLLLVARYAATRDGRGRPVAEGGTGRPTGRGRPD